MKMKMKRGAPHLAAINAKRCSFINHYHRATAIAPTASGSHPAQPFLSSDAAEVVVEATTSRTGGVVVTV